MRELEVVDESEWNRLPFSHARELLGAHEAIKAACSFLVTQSMVSNEMESRTRGWRVASQCLESRLQTGKRRVSSRG